MNTEDPTKRRWLSPKGCGLLLLLAIPALITLYLLVVAVENWRGARAWAEAEAELEAAGETTDFQTLVASRPSPSPADNFAATPILRSLVDFTSSPDGPIAYRDEESRERFLKLSLPEPMNEGAEEPHLGDWQRGRPIDLGAWQTYLGVGTDRALLDLLDSRAGAVCAELAGALALPEAQFENLQPTGNLLEMVSVALPHVTDSREAQEFLVLRANAALACGETDRALESMLLGLRIGDAIGAQSFLISTLVQIANTEQCMNAIWEGLRTGTWDERSLREIDRSLARIDLFASGHRSMQSELAVMAGGVRSYWKTAKAADFAPFQAIAELSDSDSRGPLLPFRLLKALAPSGWIDQNAALTARILGPTAIALRKRDVTTLLEKEEFEAFHRATPYSFLARITTPALHPVGKGILSGQAQVDLCRIACRLELEKLRTGNYPDALPSDLPGDLVADAPYRYERTDDGRFKLWSPGIDGIDGGGRIAFRKGSKHVDRDAGDRVWGYRPEDVLPE